MLINKIFKNKILFILKNKYIPVKNIKTHKILDTLQLSNSRFDSIIVAIFIVLLIIIKLLNIYAISELNSNIDDFILVYNHHPLREKKS